MANYRAVAGPLDLVIYKDGTEIERVPRTRNVSMEQMEAVLNRYGYDLVGPWSTVDTDMHSVQLRKG